MTQSKECAGKAAQATHSIGMGRMMGLETAADLLGQKPLADAIGINVRSLRAKLNAERGVSNADLLLAAGALVALGRRAAEHAEKLQQEARPTAAAQVAE